MLGFEKDFSCHSHLGPIRIPRSLAREGLFVKRALGLSLIRDFSNRSYSFFVDPASLPDPNIGMLGTMKRD